MSAIDVRAGCESERASNDPAGMARIMDVRRGTGWTAGESIHHGAELSAGDGAERRAPDGDAVRPAVRRPVADFACGKAVASAAALGTVALDAGIAVPGSRERMAVDRAGAA